jgi:hypothetical protein
MNSVFHILQGRSQTLRHAQTLMKFRESSGSMIKGVPEEKRVRGMLDLRFSQRLSSGI